MMKNKLVTVIFYLSIMIIGLFSKVANVMAETGFWGKSTETAKTSIDHSPWQTILSQYIQRDNGGINRFAYGDVDDNNLELLETYLEYLQQIDPRKYSRKEQKAYWINLYNALTVQVILDNYPLTSILSIGEDNKGPWDDVVAEIAGVELTLNAIEHKILRKHWQDPRIHFAVNCASIGCPNLQAQVFTATNSDQLLDKAAKEYLSHPRGAVFENNTLVLSSIFDWYGDDFGKTQQQRLHTLSTYLPEQRAKELKNYTGYIKYHYDWNLNDKVAEI